MTLKHEFYSNDGKLMRCKYCGEVHYAEDRRFVDNECPVRRPNLGLYETVREMVSKPKQAATSGEE